MNKSARHRSRVLSVQLVFASEFRDCHTDSLFDSVVNEFADDIMDDSFSRSTFNGILKQNETINSVIQESAPQWPIEKIARIDLSILKVGIYEILFNDDIPDLVAVNEAIEIAKEFGGYKTAKFINGVLSNVMNNKEKYAKM